MSDHSHHHHHQVAGGKHQKRLVGTLALVVVYMLAEVVGGLLSNSLALIADAGHMLSDAAALTISLATVWAAGLAATSRRTYGFHRAEVLGAAVNASALILVAVWILVEAFERFSAPPDVAAPLALGIATGGLGVNMIALYLLHGGASESMSVRGAWLHVLGDALGSVGAMASAGAIWAFGWRLADPLASVLIAGLVVFSGVRLLRDVVDVLMESAPGHIDVDEVRSAIAEVDNVVEVHDLHIWTITSGIYSLTGHVVIPSEGGAQTVLGEVRDLLASRFEIGHVTIQIETPELHEETICR